MTLTVIQGYKDEGDIVQSSSTTTWADLTTWTAYSDWNDAPQSVIVQIDDDNETSAYYVPTVEILAEGSISVELKTSDTGSFAGEETTSTFVEDANVAVPKARHWRWTITVEADSTTPLPVFSDALIAYDTDVIVETQEDVDILAAGTNSAGDSLVDTNLSVVRNVQATALQGGLYVEDGYVIPLQNAASGYVATAKTITNNNVTISTDEPRTDNPTSYRFQRSNNSYLEVENPTPRYLNNTNSVTFEFWVNFSSLPSGQTYYLMSLGDTDTASYDPPMLVFLNDITYTITWQLNPVGTGALAAKSTTVFTAGVWHHIAFTYDPSTYQGKLYVDGTLEDTDTWSGSDDTIETGTQTELYVGARRFDGGGGTSIDNKLNGYMDEIHITSGLKYTSNFTPADTINWTTDTQLYLDGTAIEDAVLFDGGDQPYFITQRGGGPVVENKNPLALRIVDYDGNAWDGSVDLVLRGYPYITLTDGSIGPVET